MHCKETMSLMKFTSIKKRTRDFNPFQKERERERESSVVSMQFLLIALLI
jgi:hypothetical protein